MRYSRNRTRRRDQGRGTRTRVDAALPANATTDDDIRQLRAALRGALGLGNDNGPPTLDTEWRAGWPALAELGVTAFCVPEEKDGFGLQVEAAAATAEELGAALHGSAFASLTTSAHVLAHAGSPAAEAVLAGVLSGETLCAFGVLDPVAGCAWIVDGAPDADALVLAVPATGGFLLFDDPSAWTVAVADEPFDVSRTGGTVKVDVARATPLTITGTGAGVALDVYHLLLAADAVGCIRQMHDRTVQYAGQRIAFGTPIGGFQAVQHRLADHAVKARGMALLVAEAAALLGAGSAEASRSVALATLSVTSSASAVLHDLLQLTGGIGFTWEYGLHFYERRVNQDARLVAGPRAAVRRLVEIEGWA